MVACTSSIHVFLGRPHPFAWYLLLLLFLPFYFCSLEHSMYQISKLCFLAWVVYLRLISEAWCLVFQHFLFFNDDFWGFVFGFSAFLFL
jgi:hypothetical protein